MLRIVTVTCKKCGLRSKNDFFVDSEQEEVPPDELRCVHPSHDLRAPGAPTNNVEKVSVFHEEDESPAKRHIRLHYAHMFEEAVKTK